MSSCTENKNYISPAEFQKQREFAQKVNAVLAARYSGDAPKAYVHTYGCQGNVADSQRIKGQLAEMGYTFTDTPENADFVLFNTCAVREHAETRVLGNVGALKPIKEKRRDMLIAVCGCMTQQQHVADRLKKSYPYVNLVFGTFAVYRLPELLYAVLSKGKRVFELTENPNDLAEDIPTVRDRDFKAWLPIMYGCNNFCSYCIVPYVRGRERSRTPEAVLKEAKELIQLGAKDITLLGQNVNSYGKYSEDGIRFPELLRKINALDGDFKIRFMTSHPKDCTKELLDAMADCEKCAHHLHLPFQSGNNRVLKEMNRGYTAEKYLELIDYAKKVMPDISLTGDVIVGFPGETYEEFKDTLRLIKTVKFTSLFTFIFSPRRGTKAERMDDPIPAEEKSRWFNELLKTQEEIAAERTKAMVGQTFEVLAENETKEKNGKLTGRTDGNINIDFAAPTDLIGTYVKVKVTEAGNWTLEGELSGQ